MHEKGYHETKRKDGGNKMKIALFGTNQLQFGKVYTTEVLRKLSEYGELSEKINQKNLRENAEFLKDCEIAFSTWGMPKFTKEEIREYIPNLKAVFYSAGTVQYFARPFLESGIKVFSAFAALCSTNSLKSVLTEIFCSNIHIFSAIWESPHA